MSVETKSVWAGFGLSALLKVRESVRSRRRGRREMPVLPVEILEARQVLATVDWASNATFGQFTGGEASIFGVGFDAPGVKKEPEFLGFNFDPDPYTIGGIEGSSPFAFGAQATFDARMKAGFEYGYYVNGGSASVLNDGTYTFDVFEGNVNGRTTQGVSTALRTSDSSLFTVSPKIGAYADLVLDFNVRIDAAAAFFGRIDGSLEFGAAKTFPLASINRQDANGKFDGKVKILGVDPLDPLGSLGGTVKLVDEINKSREDQTKGEIEKKAAEREMTKAKTSEQRTAAQNKLDTANSKINTAKGAETNSKNKTKGKKATNPGLGLTVSPSQPDANLLGVQVDIGVGADLGGGVGVSKDLGNVALTLPNVDLVDTTAATDGSLSATTNDFVPLSDDDQARSILSATFDAANLFALIPGPAGAIGALAGTFNAGIGPIGASITTVSYNLTLASKVNQSVKAAVDSRKLNFKFIDTATNQPVAIDAYVGRNNAKSAGVTSIQVDPGTVVNFDTLGKQVRVEQELLNQYSFTNTIGLDLGLSGKLTVLQASLSAFGAEIFSLGPLYEREDPLASVELGKVFDRTFTVSAAPVSLGSFVVGQPVADLKLTVNQSARTIDTGIGGSMQPVTYTFTVSNNLPAPGPQGPAQAAATNTVFTYELPAGYTLDASRPSTPGITQSGQKLTLNLGTLASGAQTQIVVNALTNGNTFTQRLIGTASVKADQRDPALGNNGAQTETITFSPMDFMVTVGGDTVAVPDFATMPNLRAAVTAAEGRVGPDIITFRGKGDMVIELEFGQLRLVHATKFVNALEDGGRVIIRGKKDGETDPKKHTRLFRLTLEGNAEGDGFLFDGITFENGNGITNGFTFNPVNPSLEDGFGGAIYVTERVPSEPVTLDIRNSVFRNNTTNLIERSSGGALAALNTTVKLTNVLFEGNTSFFGGGASITNAKEGSLLSRVVFDRNTAERQGGGLDTFSEGFGFSNTLRVEKTVFTGNKAGITGSAISNESFAEREEIGGIVVGVGGLDSELKFKDSLFTNNGAIDPTKTVPAVALVDTSDTGNPITTSEGNNFSDDPNIDFNNLTDKKGVLTGIVLDNATASNTQLRVPAVTKGAVLSAISIVHPFAAAPFKYLVEDRNANAANSPFVPSTRLEIVDGVLKLKDDFQFDELAGQLRLRITVTDAEGVTLVRDNVTLIIDEPAIAPTDISIGNLSIIENAPGGVVGIVTVADRSSNDEWTFDVSNDRFEVDFIQPPGQAKQYRLKLKSGVVLDFEETRSYTFDVVATDTTGLQTFKSFTVNVADLPEAPRELRSPGFGIREKRAGDTFGSIFINDDDNNETHTVTVDDPRFEIKNVVGVDGKISSRFLKLKDNVELVFADAANVNVKLTVTDKDGLKLVVDVKIPVIDNSQPNRGNVVQVYRAFNPNANFHFFTTNKGQFDNAVAAGYRDEAGGRPAFSVQSEQTPTATPLFRLYNLERGFHYYTINKAEADMLAALVPAPTSGPDNRTTGWRFEGIEGYMYSGSTDQTTTLYRLYNNDSGTHLFTEDEAQKNAILTAFPGIWVEHSPVGFAFKLQADGVLPGLDRPRTTTPPAPSSSATAAPTSAGATFVGEPSTAETTSAVFVVGTPAASVVATDLDVGLIQANPAATGAVAIPLIDLVGDEVEDDSPSLLLDEDEAGAVTSLDAYWSEFDPSSLMLVGAE